VDTLSKQAGQRQDCGLHEPPDPIRELRERFADLDLYRPPRVIRHEPGDELSYDWLSIDGQGARITVCIETFVGGGFAGQVYRVRIRSIHTDSGPVEALGGLRRDGVYAMKILIPPSTGARVFRNFLYAMGFQGPFQLQVNPVAARAGALWQRFIQRAAEIRFGEPSAVNTIHGTFVDPVLGSCGEVSDWVEGRTWRLEVDENLDTLRRWRKGRTYDPTQLGSPEYRKKKQFMADFVALLRDVGAHEFARQYEWWTCKSQPNVLKRLEFDNDPQRGLTAVDFRAGLALLPFLPMSPGDFKLIGQGLRRGRLVQFDRGDLNRLEAFVQEHAEAFADMRPMLDELKRCERVYRDSVPDVTARPLRVLYDRNLWRTILDSAVTGWKVRNFIDDDHEQRLRSSRVRAVVFLLLGLVPILGRVLRKAWGHEAWRRHYRSMLTNVDYLGRAIHGRMIEWVLAWYRGGRIGADKVPLLATSFGRFFGHKVLSVVTWAGLHRFLTDRPYRRQKLSDLFVRPIRLYFSRPLREQWMREMVKQGRRKHILTEEDARTILSHLDEPYIQRYLISLVVHLLTLPITQIVSVAIALIYYLTHRSEPNAWAVGLGIIGLFQVVPISPGSFCRGLYTTLLAIHDRNFKDYNIALFLSYFKYVGYLAFPIQMTYRYPALSRFMAGHWATDAAHMVPVFGERGALFERWVFCLFYNWPLTLRRRMRTRAALRATLPWRRWHMPISAVLVAALLVGAHNLALRAGFAPVRENLYLVGTLWPAVLAVGMALGCGVTLLAGGLSLGRRIAGAALTALAASLIYSAAAVLVNSAHGVTSGHILVALVWRAFILTLLAVVGAMVTELFLPDPASANPGGSHT